MKKQTDEMKPPKWPLRLLKIFLKSEYLEEIEGDMEERFQDDLEQYSPKKTRRMFVWQALKLIQPALIKKMSGEGRLNQYGMFKNYFKISIRHLTRHRLFTFINVFGLAIGLAGFLLINEYVGFEKSYDTFFKDADQLHRVSYVRLQNGKETIRDSNSSYLVGSALNDELPEVLQHTVTKKLKAIVFKYGDNALTENHAASADSNFLALFNYKVLKGNPETMLSEPASLVLTESRARAFFGDEDPIGKTIVAITPYSIPFKVTGVIQDIPINTHYTFDMLVSDKTLEQVKEPDYKNSQFNNYFVYLKLRKGTVVSELDEKVATIFKKFRDKNENIRLDIHPVKGIYLYSDFSYESQPLGSSQSVNFLSIVSFLILAIAWVNYVNLATARAIDRAKEVGVRKVIGALRRQLIWQFLIDALLVNFLGALLALFVVELSLPAFNQLVEKEIIEHVWNHPRFLTKLMTFWLLGAIISGVYPAMVLSGYRPISVLKGKFETSRRGIGLRKGLVIVQFMASFILITATFIIYRQVDYMQARDLGISIDKVVSVTVPALSAKSDQDRSSYREKINSFKAAVASHTAIEGLGATSNLPGGESSDINTWTANYEIVGIAEKVYGTTFVQMNDNGFLEAMDLSLLAGRNFDIKAASDSNAILVNEAFLKRSNIHDHTQIIGEKMQLGGNNFKIVGVVQDFNRASLKQQIEPTMYLPRANLRKLVVELDDENYQDGIHHLEQTWSVFFPELPIELVFLDDRFHALYAQDRQFGNIFSVFSSLAILIALLGLYGLASFFSIQRSKEVGVRKALGANKSQIIYLFYKGFFKLIGLSAVIGIPVVYYVMNNWLSNYANRIDFPWWILGGSLLTVLLFAFLTIGYQTQKVASLNPAKTLKYE